MIETQEDIDSVLEFAGETLQFAESSIKGIPAETVYNVQSFDSVYDIDKQDFLFKISYRDFVTLEIAEGTTFTYINAFFSMNFIVASWVNDLLGWIELRVNIVGIEDV